MRNTWIVEIQGGLLLLDGFLILHCFILIFKLFDYMLVNLRIDSIRIRLRNGLRNLQFILILRRFWRKDRHWLWNRLV